MNIYGHLLAACDRLNLPVVYKTDLDHDRKQLEGDDPPPVFGWVLYDCGTHLVDPRSRDNRGIPMLDVFRDVFRTMFTTDRNCFVWTGTELRPMPNADAMLDFLAANG